MLLPSRKNNLKVAFPEYFFRHRRFLWPSVSLPKHRSNLTLHVYLFRRSKIGGLFFPNFPVPNAVLLFLRKTNRRTVVVVNAS